MKRLFFNEVLLLSEKERKGIKIKLDSKRNVIIGGNGVGKSTLIKSIFYCLGAEPPMTDEWKGAEPTILLKFNVDGVNYAILREGKRISLFDSNNNIIAISKSVTKELSPLLANLFGFKLLLEDRSGSLSTPTPAFYFLPYYIDQDNGWKSPLSSFLSLTQFRHPMKDVILYHTGIRPNEFYENRKLLFELKEEEQKLQRERSGLEEVRKGLRDRLMTLEFSLDLDMYQDELNSLLKEAEKLKQELNRYRSRITDLENMRHDLKVQIEITKQAAMELESDYKFALKDQNHSIICPTCGTEYENSFMEKFQIAQDQENISELHKQLVTELTEAEEKLAKERDSFKDKSEEIDKIEEIMSIKKQEVQLRDIIESEGKREIKNILKKDSERLYEQIKKVSIEIERRNELLESITSRP